MMANRCLTSVLQQWVGLQSQSALAVGILLPKALMDLPGSADLSHPIGPPPSIMSLSLHSQDSVCLCLVLMRMLRFILAWPGMAFPMTHSGKG